MDTICNKTHSVLFDVTEVLFKCHQKKIDYCLWRSLRKQAYFQPK